MRCDIITPMNDTNSTNYFNEAENIIYLCLYKISKQIN